MKQFDVCRNPSTETAAYAPFLLVLQSNLLDELSTCVVAPLVKSGTFTPAARLNPVFEIEGEKLILSMAELAGVPVRTIGEPIMSLATEHDSIIKSLDMLFMGW